MEDDIQDIVDIEKEMTELAPSPRSEFAAVIFHNIPETYPADASIDCQYTLTSDLYPSTRDYIGLYKVGWMSYRDYIYYEWAPWPENYEAGKDTDSKVVFPVSQLPKDDGEFYQFCYVMKTGQIRGASMPFQFKRPCADDFVEEDDEECDMLIIRSKTIVLEERLKKAEEDRKKLLETQENLERERESMIAKMVELNKQLESEQESKSYLMDQLKLSHEKILQLNKEEEDMILVHDQLQQKVVELTELKTFVDGRVLALETEIEGFQRLIKSLQSEKDELMGKNQSLEQEKELYKSHVTTSESTAQSHQQEIEKLKQEVEAAREELHAAQGEYVALKVALETQKTTLVKSNADSTKDKERIEGLEEMLRNVEDKLATEENTKKMLSEEIGAFQVTQEKMSRSLENSELESDKLKDKLRAYKEEIAELKSALHEITQEKCKLECEYRDVQAELTRLVTVEKEVAVLQNQVSRTESLENELKVLQEQKKESTDTSACHFALQNVNEALKQRLTRSKKHNEDLLAHKDELLKKQKQQEQREHDLVRETEDLRERIFMCSAEYKTLFQKNRKLQKKLDKVEKLSVKSKSKSESVEGSEKGSTPETERALEKAALVRENSVTSELQEKLDLVAQELEKKQAKKGKYKKMYQEEKDRQELLRKHYYEETRRSEEELEKLRRKNSDMQAEFELKYRSMQNLLSQREREIEELARSRRHMVEIQQDKDRKPTSPRKDIDAPSYPSLYPALLFSNPYDKAGASERMPVCYPPQMTKGYIFPQPTSVYQYPAQQLPESSASSPAASEPSMRGSSDKPDSVHVEIDRMSESEASGPLDPPLLPSGPLDPPLQPTVLPLAKVAAVRSTLHSTTESKHVSEDFVLTLESSMEGETIEKVPIEGKVIPSAPMVTEAQDNEEERYQDAAGEAMKLCPSCNMTFPYDIDEQEFSLHVVSHFGRICPLCAALLDKDCSQTDFERHVNDHFKD